MKFKKIAMFIGLFVVMAATLSSCTKSFCTVNDKAQTLYALEEYAEGKTYAEGKKTQEINKDALSKGMLTPSNEFNAFIETKIDEAKKDATTTFVAIKNQTNEIEHKEIKRRLDNHAEALKKHFA